MQHFIDTLSQYSLTVIIETNWTKLREKIKDVIIYEDVMRLHNDFLNRVLDKCFIDRRNANRVSAHIEEMF